jgi:hypothetical protein
MTILARTEAESCMFLKNHTSTEEEEAILFMGKQDATRGKWRYLRKNSKSKRFCNRVCMSII